MRREIETRLIVQVKANCKRSEVNNFDDETLNVKVAAPPAQGKANKELIAILSKRLDVSKSHIWIEKGATRKRKLIVVRGLTRNEVMQRLGLT